MADLVLLAAGAARRYGSFKPLAPVGPRGEALVDLAVRDAVSAGFDRVVFVVRKQTEEALAYHVRKDWPATLPVTFVCQDADEPVAGIVARGGKPPGTAHAVLSAREAVRGSFAVVNGDDLYGADALGLLAGHLSTGEGPDAAKHALVAYRLRNTVLTDGTVTRATCERRAGGDLAAILERSVTRQSDGTFSSPAGELTGDELVSVNLWGFRPSIFPVLEKAVDAFFAADPLGGTRASAKSGTNATTGAPGDEVLLPTVVGAMLGDPDAAAVRVIETDAECLGVTHASDRALLHARLADRVAQGRAPERLWEGVA